MSRYNYIAKTLQGKSRSGILEAEDEHELARILRKEGSILIKASSEEENDKESEGIITPPADIEGAKETAGTLINPESTKETVNDWKVFSEGLTKLMEARRSSKE